MKVFAVTVLLAVLASCHGYSYIIPASMKHPGICYYNGHVLPKGDSQMPTSCQNMRCNDDGSILVQGCGQMGLHRCTLLRQTKLNAPYPECCEMTYQCMNDAGRIWIQHWNQVKQGSPIGGMMGEQWLGKDVSDEVTGGIRTGEETLLGQENVKTEEHLQKRDVLGLGIGLENDDTIVRNGREQLLMEQARLGGVGIGQQTRLGLGIGQKTLLGLGINEQTRLGDVQRLGIEERTRIGQETRLGGVQQLGIGDETRPGLGIEKQTRLGGVQQLGVEERTRIGQETRVGDVQQLGIGDQTRLGLGIGQETRLGGVQQLGIEERTRIGQETRLGGVQQLRVDEQGRLRLGMRQGSRAGLGIGEQARLGLGIGQETRLGGVQQLRIGEQARLGLGIDEQTRLGLGIGQQTGLGGIQQITIDQQLRRTDDEMMGQRDQLTGMLGSRLGGRIGTDESERLQGQIGMRVGQAGSRWVTDNDDDEVIRQRDLLGNGQQSRRALRQQLEDEQLARLGIRIGQEDSQQRTRLGVQSGLSQVINDEVTSQHGLNAQLARLGIRVGQDETQMTRAQLGGRVGIRQQEEDARLARLGIHVGDEDSLLGIGQQLQESGLNRVGIRLGKDVEMTRQRGVRQQLEDEQLARIGVRMGQDESLIRGQSRMGIRLGGLGLGWGMDENRRDELKKQQESRLRNRLELKSRQGMSVGQPGIRWGSDEEDDEVMNRLGDIESTRLGRRVGRVGSRRVSDNDEELSRLRNGQLLQTGDIDEVVDRRNLLGVGLPTILAVRLQGDDSRTGMRGQREQESILKIKVGKEDQLTREEQLENGRLRNLRLDENEDEVITQRDQRRQESTMDVGQIGSRQQIDNKWGADNEMTKQRGIQSRIEMRHKLIESQLARLGIRGRQDQEEMREQLGGGLRGRWGIPVGQNKEEMIRQRLGGGLGIRQKLEDERLARLGIRVGQENVEMTRQREQLEGGEQIQDEQLVRLGIRVGKDDSLIRRQSHLGIEDEMTRINGGQRDQLLGQGLRQQIDTQLPSRSGIRVGQPGKRWGSDEEDDEVLGQRMNIRLGGLRRDDDDEMTNRGRMQQQSRLDIQGTKWGPRRDIGQQSTLAIRVGQDQLSIEGTTLNDQLRDEDLQGSRLKIKMDENGAKIDARRMMNQRDERDDDRNDRNDRNNRNDRNDRDERRHHDRRHQRNRHNDEKQTLLNSQDNRVESWRGTGINVITGQRGQLENVHESRLGIRQRQVDQEIEDDLEL